ncbi:hypothetical protein FRC17_000545 [Serendipita sp. 399]|nr:hypothetical protein FRC17_000545 [Serendipita sp. 399]
MALVQLYVYDLSRGMASQLSQQLTGRHIEGVWHTSIVFHGKEYWYGQGIGFSAPGQSQLGRPLRVVDLGVSEIDEETFMDYINELRTVYTSGKYHLLDFNCNSFTNDLAGFLTGGSIPAYVRDLPADFLSTPLGAALRPTIDQMFRGPRHGYAMPSNDPASQIVQSVSENALASPQTGQTAGLASTSTLTAPIQICNNPSSFTSLIRRHKAAVAFFTSQTCAPCRMVEPGFDEIAHSRASPDVAFIKVDMSVGMGHLVGQQNNVHATPTFLFFLNGNLRHELKGIDVPELRTQVNLLIYDAFPPHPHAKLSLRELRCTSLKPILFSQVPKFDALSNKLLATVDTLGIPVDQKKSGKAFISEHMVPYLSTKLGAAPGGATNRPAIFFDLALWSKETKNLSKAIPPASLFPLVDLWRLAVLNPDVSAPLVTTSETPLVHMLKIALDSMSSTETRNLSLTAVRLACNLFANPALGRRMLQTVPYGADGIKPRDVITGLLVSSLLSDVPNVRIAGASLAFNVSAFLQAPLMECLSKGMTGQMKKEDAVDDPDWELEILSAVVEAIEREENEDSLHRLVTCLGLLVHLSPHLEEIRSLLEVLQVKETLQSKVDNQTIVKKDTVRKLAKEMLDELMV